MKNKLSTGVHFVWATWDRQPLITADVERRLFRYMETICDRNKCRVLALNAMPDHIHLFVLLSNTVTLADLMKDVKGASSRFFSQTLKPGEWFAWQGSYGASFVSRSHYQAVIRYIENQKPHHAAPHRLWPEAEETCETVDEAEGEAEGEASGRRDKQKDVQP